MKKMAQLMTMFGAVALLALFSPVFANEYPEPNLAKDAAEAPGMPMVIPHAVTTGEDGESCNACHQSGMKKIPQVSHPERLNCTQCHVQGPIKKSGKGKPRK